MRKAILGLLLLTSVVGANERTESTFEGTWLTTNRKLDGTMTCVVTRMADEEWHGHFHGVWNGASFAYKVKFSGPPEKLYGTAVIDGADYQWTGSMTERRFQGSFGGSRYAGSFDLRRKK